jgi:hypothetical protein
MITIIEILKRSLDIVVENSISWEEKKLNINSSLLEKISPNYNSDDKIYSMTSKFEITKSEGNIEEFKKLTNFPKEKKIRPGKHDKEKEKYEEIIDELF